MKKFLFQIITYISILKSITGDTSASTIIAKPYIIYHKGKTFPRPLLKNNTNEIIAFSGTKSPSTLSTSSNAFLSKYNSKGELIEESENTDLEFEYSVNVCIRQLGNNLFIAVSGEGDLNLILFNETKIIKRTTFRNTYVISFKIDVYVTHENNMIISYCSGKEICEEGESLCKIIKVQKFTLDYNTNTFYPIGNLWEVNSDNRYISCVEMGENVDYKILCLYITENCNEQISIYDKNLNLQNSHDLLRTSSCPFDKMIKLDDIYAVATYQDNTTMKFTILKVHENDYEIDFILHNSEVLRDVCILNTNKVDTAKWDYKTFVYTCIHNSVITYSDGTSIDQGPSVHNIHVGIVHFDNSSNTFSVVSFSTKHYYTDFPFISKFGLNYMSIFYHIQHDGSNDDVFEILGYPACANREFELIYINSNTEPFDLSDFVVEGSGEAELNPLSYSNNDITIYFPEEFSYGEIRISGEDNPIIPRESEYPKNTLFKYYSGYDYGIFRIKFQPVRGDNKGRNCWLIFKVSDCHEGCFTCKIKSINLENHECLICDNDKGYYESKVNDDSTINCENVDNYDGYYVDENKKFQPCDTNCKTCKIGPSDGNQNCISCKDNYYFKSDELDSLNRSITGNCYPVPQEGYYIKIDDNLINGKIHQKCNIACKSCNGPSNSLSTNCVLCDNDNGFYKTTIDESNCLIEPFRYTFNSELNAYEPCMEGCLTCTHGIDHIIINSDLRLANYFCEKCDQLSSEKYYRLIHTNNCFKNEPEIYDDDGIKINYYLDNESYDNEKDWEWVNCYKKCEKCSNLGNDDIMNCDICKSEYYHEMLPSTNCIESCPNYLGIKEIDNTNKWCVNCKEEKYGNSISKYKYIGNNELYESNYCIHNKPIGTYIDNSNYNTLKDCDISCYSCEISSTFCTNCSEGYIFHPLIENKCVQKCTTKYWYINDNNEYKCINDCNEIEDCIRTYLGDNQCVNKCDDDNCVFCKKNKAYLIYDKYCKFKCPKGYEIDSTGEKCILKKYTENGCNIKLYPSRHSTLIKNLKLFAFEWIEKYIYQYDKSLMKNVDILPSHNMTMQIWKDDICEWESSLLFNISFVNTTKCRKILQEKYSLPDNGILFVKFDINRTLLINQIHYNAYNAFTKEKLNLSYCKGDIIYYSLNEKGANFELSKRLYDKLKVDIFNSTDDFFNDNCYHFDDEGKDITLNERRLFYFQKVPLCEKGCIYKGINYTQNTLLCYCENSLPTLEEATEISTPDLNEANFINKISNSNFDLFKCSNLVFSLNNLKKNPGSIIILILGCLQIPLLFSYSIIIGLNPIYSFLNKFSYKNNPPKKNINNYLNDDISQEKSIKYLNDTKKEENNEINTNIINFTNTTAGNIKNENNTISNSKSKSFSRNKSNKIIIYKENNTSNRDNHTIEKFMPNFKLDEEKDEEVKGFDEDEMDELNYSDAVKFDERDFLSFLWRVMKKKIFFIFPFNDLNVFEPFSIKLMWFIFLISSFFFFNAIFFKKLYVQLRFYEVKKVGFGYFVKKEIQVSIYSSLISSFIGILLSYLISIKKKFVVCIRQSENQNEFLNKIKRIIFCYKIKIIIFIIIDFICMFVFWYFCTVFCSMYIKTIKAWFYAFIFTFIFTVIIEFLFSFIITCLRFIGLSLDLSCFYIISKTLF